MLWLRSMAGAGAVAVVALMVGSVSARAADPAEKTPVVKTAPPAASSQTASIDKTAPATVQAPALKFDIDAYRFDDNAAKAGSSSLTTPVVPVAPNSVLDNQTGARFVPMFRSSASAIDPNNRGNFFDNHTVGVELKSDF